MLGFIYSIRISKMSWLYRKICIESYVHIHTRDRRYIYLQHERFPTYLSLRSTFLSQGNCPARCGRSPDSFSLGRREEKEGWWGENGDEKRESGGRDVHFSKEQSYITTREKRPSTGRLISKALPPTPFTAPLNPRAWHEFRHSEPNPSLRSLYLFRLTTARHDEKRRRVQSSPWYHLWPSNV